MDLDATLPLLAVPLVGAAVGACAGSFAATAALRSLRFEQAVAGRSHCDDCGTVLGAASTIPIFAYAIRRGACSHCGGRIAPAHLAGELAGAVVVAAAFWLTPPMQASVISLLGLVLVGASIVDQQSRRLPDVLTLAVAFLSLTLAAMAGKILVGLAAAGITFLLLDGLRLAFLRYRGRGGLGGGDVKLLSALALWLGAATPWALVLASLAGLAVVRFARPEDGRIAFGPLIAGAALVVGIAVAGRLIPAGWMLA